MITSENIFKVALLEQLKDLLVNCNDSRTNWLQEQITNITCLRDIDVDCNMYQDVLKQFIRLED